MFVPMRGSSLWFSAFTAAPAANGRLAIAAFLALGGCVPERTVHQVELCLTGEQQTQEFYAYMRTVADRGGLDFIDGAARYDENTLILGVPAQPAAKGPTIFFSALSGTGAGGFSAGNPGLNSHQIALGMDATEDPRFNDEVIEATTDEIIRRWPARRVPSSETFHPRPGCGDGSA